MVARHEGADPSEHLAIDPQEADSPRVDRLARIRRGVARLVEQCTDSDPLALEIDYQGFDPVIRRGERCERARESSCVAVGATELERPPPVPRLVPCDAYPLQRTGEASRPIAWTVLARHARPESRRESASHIGTRFARRPSVDVEDSAS